MGPGEATAQYCALSRLQAHRPSSHTFLGPWAPLCSTPQISISLSINALHEIPKMSPPGAKPAGSS